MIENVDIGQEVAVSVLRSSQNQNYLNIGQNIIAKTNSIRYATENLAIGDSVINTVEFHKIVDAIATQGTSYLLIYMIAILFLSCLIFVLLKEEENK